MKTWSFAKRFGILLLASLVAFSGWASAEETNSFSQVLTRYELALGLFDTTGTYEFARESFAQTANYLDSALYRQYIDAYDALLNHNPTAALPALAILSRLNFLDADALLAYATGRIMHEQGHLHVAALMYGQAPGVLASDSYLQDIIEQSDDSFILFPIDAAVGNSAVVLETSLPTYDKEDMQTGTLPLMTLLHIADIRFNENGQLMAGFEPENEDPIALAEVELTYVSAESLYFMSPDATTAYLESLNVTDEATEDAFSPFAEVTGHQVNIRSEMWRTYSRGLLNRHETVEVLEEGTADNGATWYWIRRNDGTEGYVPGKYLRLFSPQEVKEHKAALAAAHPEAYATPLPPLPLLPTPSTEEAVVMAVQTAAPTSIPFTVPSTAEEQFDLALYLLLTDAESSYLRAMTLLSTLQDIPDAHTYGAYAQLLFMVAQGDYVEARNTLNAYTGNENTSPLALPSKADLEQYVQARELESIGEIQQAIDLYVQLQVHDSVDRAVWLQSELPLANAQSILAEIKTAQYQDIFAALQAQYYTPEPEEEPLEEPVEELPQEEIPEEIPAEPTDIADLIAPEEPAAPEIRYAYRYNELTPGDPYYTWAPIDDASAYHVVTVWKTATSDGTTDPKEDPAFLTFKAKLNAVGKSEDQLASVYDIIEDADDTLWQTTEIPEIDMSEIFAHIERAAKEASQGNEYATSFLIFVLYE